APRTGSAGSARRSGRTWRPPSGTRCTGAPAGWCCTAGEPGPPWRCTPRGTRRCTRCWPAWCWTRRCWTGAPRCARCAPHAALRGRSADGGVPRALWPLAVRAAEGRAGLCGTGPLGPPGGRWTPDVPTLLLHGPDDPSAPWEPSRELARDRPDLVTLHTVEQA